MDVIRKEGHIYKSAYGTYDFSVVDLSKHGYMQICPYVLEFTIPDAFNPVAAEIAMYETKLDALAEEYQQKIGPIKERIVNLQSIEYSPKEK